MRFRFWRLGTVGMVALALGACGEQGEAQSEAAIQQVARDLEPKVEMAVGLPFKAPPAIALRTRAQVRSYLAHKLEDEYGPQEFAQAELAYRLFGLIPDTLDLKSLLLALYTEQVVGYYDPDSTTLYVVEGAMPENVRLTLAHELVHALQGQYVPLDSLLSIRRDNDRRTAAQAVMEGQATLVTVRIILPQQDMNDVPQLWDEYRQAVRQQQEQMPVFSTAPLVIREGLIFPYLAGADFVRWFNREYADTVPFGPRLPHSTEQILHPGRYRLNDQPVELAFGSSAALLYDDDLGEFETRILLTALTGSEARAAAGALGWGGDRYGVFSVDRDSLYALVWWSVWDTPQAATRFADLLNRGWHAKPNRRSEVREERVDGHPAVRFVDAPERWDGWKHVPQVQRRSKALEDGRGGAQ